MSRKDRHTEMRMAKARRDVALTRPELRGTSFVDVNDKLPDEGQHCFAMAADFSGQYRLPFHVYRMAHYWYNAKHDRVLQIEIVAWQYK